MAEPPAKARKFDSLAARQRQCTCNCCWEAEEDSFVDLITWREHLREYGPHPEAKQLCEEYYSARPSERRRAHRRSVVPAGEEASLGGSADEEAPPESAADEGGGEYYERPACSDEALDRSGSEKSLSLDGVDDVGGVREEEEAESVEEFGDGGSVSDSGDRFCEDAERQELAMDAMGAYFAAVIARGVFVRQTALVVLTFSSCFPA